MAINIPNGRNIVQMAIKYSNIFYFKALQNLTQIGIFGLKIYHLATLLSTYYVPGIEILV
jgi:hypothetical protein